MEEKHNIVAPVFNLKRMLISQPPRPKGRGL